MAQLVLSYQVKESFRSDRYTVKNLVWDCNDALSDRENLDNAFAKACELGANPNKNIRWKFIK